ncbi:MAG: Gfo/Idh/MocA family protein [Thermoguttaceae bacterium]
MAGKTYGVLIQGAGWVSSQHLSAYQNNPSTRIVAICDRVPEKAQARAAEAGLKDVGLYTDLTSALKHPGVDLVSICTPQHVHCENALEVAAAGKHMIIEKPAGISLDQLRRMRDAVRAAGVKTVVSFVLRWNPLFRTLKAMLADNAFGRPYYVEADYYSYNGSWWSGWGDTYTLKNGVSAFLAAGCHAIDAIRWFAAEGEFQAAKPVEVFAVCGGRRKGSSREYNPITNTWRDDGPAMEYDGLEVALVKFDNGTVGKVSVNAECVMPYKFPIRIFGDQGSVIDNSVWSHKYPGQTDWIELKSVLPGSSDVRHHPFQGEIDHFVKCVQDDVQSHCNLEDALKTHEIVFAAQQCYREGRPVRLPLLEK